MFSFASSINLPLFWGFLIATTVFLYVFLDGFDLGIGILFPFAPGEDARTRMANSIAPFWDANETWLVLGGGGLFAAFPLAYSIILPALYIPVTLMLLSLIFRGVAFEFRFKAEGPSRKIWDYAFHSGSLGAAFMQGIILGGFVQGITVKNGVFAGDPFDWLTAFSLMTGLGVVSGYVLLGATWLVWKTDGSTQVWARRYARYIGLFVLVFIGLVSLWVPFLHSQIGTRWFGTDFWWLLPLPVTTLIFFGLLYRSLSGKKDWLPFVCSFVLFLLAYLGLGISLWPWAVPFSVTLAEAAAAPESLSLLLVGAGIMLPVVVAYTIYCHFIFRGKTSIEPLY
jgi:cytochrome d ubiquinol oxidase subunit II